MTARMSVSTGKMAKVQEQVQCVLWLAELQSVTSVGYNGVLEPDMDVILLQGKAFDSGTINSEQQEVCYE
ncbi:hypothetical protein C0J52_27140 [Blattella germanica]|nr:hypothetical protein C0J52_27140 [Blattella germanica]